jgi:hypothetical protein
MASSRGMAACIVLCEKTNRNWAEILCPRLGVLPCHCSWRRVSRGLDRFDLELAVSPTVLPTLVAV